jgi:hypothetical protein
VVMRSELEQSVLNEKERVAKALAGGSTRAGSVLSSVKAKFRIGDDGTDAVCGE